MSSEGHRDDHGELLLIRTREKVIARRVFEAAPLSPVLAQGYAAELATHDAATVWGLPDFMYRAAAQRIGSGNRELGDGLIVVGVYGLVLQVKSRSEPGDDDRERRWLQKKVAQALRQGDGTIRRLRAGGVRLENRRGRQVVLKSQRLLWHTVVIVDHVSPPADVELAVPGWAVAMLRRDWEFLFEQLKSTHAVAQYCARVAGESIALGAEPLRYYELARADSGAKPKALSRDLVGPGVRISKPLLPFAPVGSDDLEAVALVRELMESIASRPSAVPDEADRLRVLGELDRLPVASRADIGRFLLHAIGELTHQASGDIQWRARSVRGPAGHIHLGFVACSRPHSLELQDVFRLWVRLRHHDVLSARGDADELLTVAVLLTPRPGSEDWDTTMAAMSGDPEFTSEELELARSVWPTGGHAAAVA